MLLIPALVSTQDFYTSANTLYKSSHFEKAIEFLDQKEGPLSWNEWKLLGDCYHKLKSYSDASDCYSQAISLHSEDAECWARRGAVQLELGQIGFAIEDVRKALKLMPTLAEAHFNKGNICYDQEDWSNAKKNYQKALELDVNYTEARYMLAASLSQIGQHGRAIEEFNAVKEEYPLATYNMAVAQLESENYLEAITLFDKIQSARFNELPDYHYFKAEANYYIGNKDKACESYSKAADLGDNDSQRIIEAYCMKGGKKAKSKKRETVKVAF